MNTFNPPKDILERLNGAKSDHSFQLTLPKASSALRIHSHTFLEGTHLDFQTCGPQNIGERSLALALNDIACGGSTPKTALLTLGLKPNIHGEYLTQLFSGLRREAKRSRVKLQYGTTTLSNLGMFLHFATAASPLKVRQCAIKEGQKIAVTGFPGDPAAAMYGLGKFDDIHRFETVVRSYLRPNPRIPFIQGLIKSKKVSWIHSLQDGISTVLDGFCEAEKFGALIVEEAIPTSTGADRIAQYTQQSALRWAAYGSESCEVAIAFSQKDEEALQKLARRARVKLTVVGEVAKKNSGARIIRKDQSLQSLPPRSWHPAVRRS